MKGKNLRLIISILLLFLATLNLFAEIKIDHSNSKCICGEGSPGKIAVIATGTAGPFTFSWDGPSGTPSDMQNLENITVEGTYMVTVTNAYMCETVLTTQIEMCDGIDDLIFEGGNSCISTSTGFINLTVSGGTEPFSFTWSTTETTQNISNLDPGQYCVTVVDGNGCETSDCFSISSEDNVIITPIITNSCEDQSDGSIELIVTGGMAPYEFIWEDNIGITPVITELDPGQYDVTVVDNNGCSQSGSFIVGELPAPFISFLKTDNCTGEPLATGAIQIEVSGTTPYTYAWSHGSTEQDQQELSGGTYKVTVTDAIGCIAIETFIIEDLIPPVISGEVELASCLESTDGQITLSIDSDAPSYNISWNNGLSTEAISNLSADEYCVTVMDANGCSTTQCFQTMPTEPQKVLPFVQKVEIFAVSTTTSQEDLIYQAEWMPVSAGCFIYTSGMESIPQILLDDIALGNREVKVIAISNIPLAFLNLEWEGLTISTPLFPNPSDDFTTEFILDAVDASNIVSNNTINQTLIFTGNDFAIPPNDLVDMNTASNNKEDCVDVPALQIDDCLWSPLADPIWNNFDDVHVLERECLEIRIIDINPTLGEIRVDAEGGLEPYDFIWSNENGFSALGKIITGVPPGEYCVRVKDANACIVELCIELCPPLQDLIDDISVIEPVCNDLTGGRLCIDDANGKYSLQVLWSTGSEELCIDDLIGTTYQVTITELNCGQTIEHAFDLGNIALPPMNLSFGGGTPSCSGSNNGSVCVAVSGGKSPYTYTWENGSTSPCADGINTGQCHSVTVTDACGDQMTQCFNIPIYQLPAIEFVEVNNTCGDTNTGSAQVNFSGGKKPFIFTWIGPGVNVTNAQEFLNSLPVGSYTVTMTDACGNSSSSSFTINSDPTPESLDISNFTITHVCGDEPNGAIDITVNYPGSVFYNWSNGASTQDISGLSSGNYTVTISNFNGCEVVSFFTVTQSTFNKKVDVIPSCFNGGMIVIDPFSNPFSPLTYAWSNGMTTASIDQLQPGIYTVTITNSIGCAMVEEYMIPVGDLMVNGVITDACDDTGGAINLLPIDGGSGPFNYKWSDGATTEHLIGIESGVYCVTVENNWGCTGVNCFEVGNHNSPMIADEYYFEGATTSPVGGEIATGLLDISVISEDPNLNFLWSNGATTEDISNLISGVYSVTVTDENGCSASASFVIPACSPVNPSVIAFPNQIVPVTEPNTGSIELTIEEGNLPLTFSWSGPSQDVGQEAFTSTDQNIFNLSSPGEYCVTVTDNCNSMTVYCVELLSTCPERIINLDALNNCLQHDNPDHGDSKLIFKQIYMFNHVSNFLHLEWSTGETGLITLQADGNHFYSPATILEGVIEIDVDPENLPPNGVFSVIVTDDWGCQTVASAQFGVPQIQFKPLDEYIGFLLEQYEETYISPVYGFIVCETCGFIYNGADSEYYCNESSEHLLEYVPDPTLNPNAPNVCQMGGMIAIGNSGLSTITVPPNSVGTFIEEGGYCGCLFPPGTMDLPDDIDWPVYLNEGEAYILATLPGCELPSEVTININVYTNPSGETVTCPVECEPCILEPSVEQLEGQCASFNLICASTGEPVNLTPLSIPEKQCRCELAEGNCLVVTFCEDDPCKKINYVPYYPCDENLNLPPCKPCLCPAAFDNPNSEDHFLIASTDEEDTELINFQKEPLNNFDLDKVFSSKVHPNPFSIFLNIEVFSKRETITRLRVVNILGKTIFSQKYDIAKGVTPLTLNINDQFTNGVYQLIIEDDQGNFNTHLIVHSKN